VVPAILEADGVRGEHYDASFGQRWTEGLERVSGQPTDLTLAEMPLSIVLMMDHNRSGWLPHLLRQKEKRRNGVAIHGTVGNG